VADRTELASPSLTGLNGMQRWVHDLAALAAMPPRARDHVIGRQL